MKKRKLDLKTVKVLTRGQLKEIFGSKLPGGGSVGGGCSSSLCRSHSDCTSGIEDVINSPGYCRTCVVYTPIGYGYCGGSPL